MAGRRRVPLDRAVVGEVDRKTVCRYVSAATELGSVRDGGVGQLGDEFVAAVVPLRTVLRYVRDECGRHCRRGPPARVADGETGDELQVDFGRMGHFEVDGRRRVVWALIFKAVYSRHCFVWLSHRQTPR